MKKMSFLVSLVLLVCAAAFVSADEKKGTAAKAPEHTMFAPADIQWADAPPILPAGAKAAVLDGDPSKPGYFAMRLKMPDGYKIMPHWHPNMERLTVISGTLNMGLGDTFDESKGHAMSAGTYGSIQPNVHHFAWATGETEIQITTLGPWKLVYVNPKDDPSKK
jgi:quercetin dioxygenase-like cupin family protein